MGATGQAGVFDPAPDVADEATVLAPSTTPARDDIESETAESQNIGADRLPSERATQADAMPPLAPPTETKPAGEPVPLTAGFETAKSVMPPAAILRLQAAAKGGDAAAQFELAVAYEKGTPVEKDIAWAARWYGQAALQGHKEAQYRYANLKMAGPGEYQRDLAGAYRWLTLAARQGHHGAAEKLTDLELNLDLNTLYQEKRRVDAFAPTDSVSPSDPPAVEYVQRKLVGFGYDPGPPDGHMGARTSAALEAFQADQGLTITSRISDDLLERIRIMDPVVSRANSAWQLSYAVSGVDPTQDWPRGSDDRTSSAAPQPLKLQVALAESAGVAPTMAASGRVTDATTKPPLGQSVAQAAEEPVEQEPATPPTEPSIDLLLSKGKKLQQLGDIASARLFFELAAEYGSPAAAKLMGETFDPLLLKEAGVIGLKGDSLQAIEWYKRAVTAGDKGAAKNLTRLEGSLGQ
jgi:TPR repeat protein